MSSVVGVIPVRYGATRFPGKPLAPILGKPMLQWVLEGVSQSQKLKQIIVATDHEDIAQLAKKLGYEYKMTDSQLPSGSDRVWQAVQDIDCDIVLNIQGDEPLIRGDVLDELINKIEATSDQHIKMWTLADEIIEEALSSPQAVKIVLDRDNCALYFSRFAIPYSRQRWGGSTVGSCLKHIGIYAYRKKFLKEFCQQEPISLEKAEGLEQLRALYLGARIQVVKVDYESWGVDVPEDVKKIESMLSKK